MILKPINVLYENNDIQKIIQKYLYNFTTEQVCQCWVFCRLLLFICKHIFCTVFFYSYTSTIFSNCKCHILSLSISLLFFILLLDALFSSFINLSAILECFLIKLRCSKNVMSSVKLILFDIRISEKDIVSTISKMRILRLLVLRKLPSF